MVQRMTATEPSVLVEQQGGVTIVRLSRPGRRNGVTMEMCEELYDALRPLAAGDSRVVVLRGAGDDFSVGADLKGGGQSAGTPTFERLASVYHASTLLHSMPQITIAAIDGGCAGAAMGWACACDFRFASDRARLATGFLKVGASGDMGLIWSLVRIVGAARARELLLFGEKLTAEDALSFGLVTRVFGADSLHQEVMALANELAGYHPSPLRMMKANLLSAERLDLEEYIEIESARHLHVVAGRSFREGRERFVQGRSGASS
jgi:2-(1,2-epoxy-1,2-dihydrophenyl)acetyl-CoA isomerase